MNILIYSSEGFNPTIGGVERVSNIQAEIFQQKGHKVYVFCKLRDCEASPYAEIYHIPKPKDILSSENLEMFLKIVQEKQIDIILCQYPYEEAFTTLPYWVKQKTGVKLLYLLHQAPDFRALLLEDTTAPILPSERTLPKLIKRWFRVMLKERKQKDRNRKMGVILKAVYEKGDGVVLLSANFMPIFSDMTGITDTQKLYAISNPNTYSPEVITDTEKENILLFVGRLADNQKRPERVLLVWKKIQHLFPDWQVKIVGDGNIKEDIAFLIRKMGLERCSLEGRKDPKPYYEKAKIFLMTSDFEGFGMVLTEALQHGVVPIAFNSYAALSDIIIDEVTGVHVTPFNMEEYEQKLVALMRDEEKRQKIAAAGKEDVKKFSKENIAQQWESLLQKIVKQ